MMRLRRTIDSLRWRKLLRTLHHLFRVVGCAAIIHFLTTASKGQHSIVSKQQELTKKGLDRRVLARRPSKSSDAVVIVQQDKVQILP
jgi:hypothetical protein